MNLLKLFETQKKLDDRIVKEKGLKGQDLLDKKILALRVELGELAQNWRGFKFWSEDQEPRTEISYAICNKCGGTGTPIGIPDYAGVDCWECEGSGELIKNPLLEEYVDCLHFILSIGLEVGIEQDIYPKPFKYYDAVTQFNELFGQITYFDNALNWGDDWEVVEFEYERVCSLFFGLGSILGFNWKEIEQAYYAKNKVNHERQENGY